MLFKSSILLLISTSLLSISAQLQVNSGKLILLNAAGISQLTKEFTSSSHSPAPLTEITPSNVLQLNFIVTDGETPIQPQQAAILWEPVDPEEKLEAGRDHLSTIKVRKGGKGKWEVDFSRAPTSILAVSRGPISATLILGSANLAPVQIPLGTFHLAPSLSLEYPYPGVDTLPASWEVERYSLMPELKWTFRAKEKKVKTPLAILGTVFVLLPWVVIFGAASHISPSLASPTLNILSFLLCIFSFESLIVAYWTSLTLISTLPYFALIGALTAFTGRRALGDMKTNRLRREMGEKKSL